MQISDDAFIARDLAHFNHHPNCTIHYPLGVTMDLTQHLTDMRLTFATYSDAAPHNHNYKVLFGEGDWTIALARASGTNDGPLIGPKGELVPPTMRTVTYDLMTIVRWNGGLMMEEFLWTDNPSVYRQLGFLPTKPAKDLPDLEMNDYTAPLSTQPGVDSAASNKALAKAAEGALNAGRLDADGLRVSPNVTVYGLNDEGLGLQGYLDAVASLRTAFPDLALANQQVIAQGDWTATVGRLSGTHEGALLLPPYLAQEPVAATGKRFDLLHYNIARWQDGKIVEMRVNVDTFGILSALGIDI